MDGRLNALERSVRKARRSIRDVAHKDEVLRLRAQIRRLGVCVALSLIVAVSCAFVAAGHSDAADAAKAEAERLREQRDSLRALLDEHGVEWRSR